MNDSDIGSNVVVLDAVKCDQYAARYTNVVNLLLAKWSYVLAPVESMALLFVNARTYKYGKGSEVIPLTHFLEGVRSAEGETVHAGLGIGKSTLQRALTQLEELELVRVTRRKRRGANAPAVFAIDFKTLQIGPEGMSKLRLPKNFRGGVKMNPRWCQNEPTVGSKRPLEIADSNKQILNSRNMADRSAPAEASLNDSIEAAKTKTRTRRKAKAATVSTRITQKGLKALWEELMAEHYSHVPHVPMSRIEWAIFKRQYDAMNLQSMNVEVILRWVVDNWVTVIAQHVNWITKKEGELSMPSLAVIGKYLRYFIQAFNQYADRDYRTSEDYRRTKREKQRVAISAGVSDAERARILELERELHEKNVALQQSAKTNMRLSRELKQRRNVTQVPVVNYDDIEDIGDWEDNGD